MRDTERERVVFVISVNTVGKYINGMLILPTIPDSLSNHTAEMEVKASENIECDIGKYKKPPIPSQRYRQKDLTNRSPLTKARFVNPATGAFSRSTIISTRAASYCLVRVADYKPQRMHSGVECAETKRRNLTKQT